MGTFLIRRILRTWPLYFLVVLVCFLFPQIVEGPLEKSLISFLTFTMNFNLKFSGLSHMWTLCVEEVCYLAFFFLIPLLGFKRILWVFGAMALLSLGLRIHLSNQYGLMGPEYFTKMWYPTFHHWDSFWYGCIAGVLYDRHKMANLKIKPLLLVASVLLMFLYLFLRAELGPGFRQLTQIINPLWGTLISLCLVLGVEAVPLRWLTIMGLPQIGRISYTLYLTHKLLIFNFVVINRRFDFLPAKGWLELAGCYVFLFAFGFVIFWLFERPLLKLLSLPWAKNNLAPART
jgi:peptidoglycan/LPS O-acetylase OafA/YrhL